MPTWSLLETFLLTFPARAYRSRRGGGEYPEHELEPASQADGLSTLNQSPADGPELGVPRRSADESGQSCYLWVIDARGVPYIAEGPRTGAKFPFKHTNLTGGGEASIGGEAWFSDPLTLYISGSSGRYPPDSANHLRQAEELIRRAGFTIRSLGWDEDTGQPRRIWLDGAE